MDGERWAYKSLELTFEEPDTLLYRVVGDELVDADSVRWLVSVTQKLQQTKEHLYVLVELGTTGSRLTTAARQELKSMPVAHASTLCFFGGNLAARAIAQVVLRGLVLVGIMKVRMTHHRNEKEARSWIREDRGSHAAAATNLLG